MKRKSQKPATKPLEGFSGPPAGGPHSFEGVAPIAADAFTKFADEQMGKLENITERIEAIDTRSAKFEESVDAKFEKLRSDSEGRFSEIADRLAKDKDVIAKMDESIARANATKNQLTEPERRLANAFANELATGEGMKRYREMVEGGNKKACHRFAMNAMLPISRAHGFAGESTVVIDSDLVGDGSDPYVRQGLTELIRDPIGLLDVIYEVPGVPDVDTFKEMVEDEEGNMAAVATAANGAQDGGAVAQGYVTVHNTEGFYVGQSIYVWATAAGKKGPYVITAITAGTTLTVTAGDIDFLVEDGSLVTGEEFVATAEGSVKPAGALKASLQSATIQTLATYVIMTRQRLRRTNLFDLAAWAARTLPMRLRESLEQMLLYGSGTAPQFPGFLNSTQMTAYGVSTDTWGNLEVGTNRADAILYSAANIPGDRQKVCVMNKLDWYLLTSAKDENGNYVHGAGEGPRIIDTPALKAIGGVRVVLSSRIVQPYALVMDAQQASSFVRIPDAEMTVGYVNDQYITNQQTMLYEQSFAHLLKVGSAWRRVYLNNPPT